MHIQRSKKNPVITPDDVRPSRPDFKVLSYGLVKIYYGAADTCIAYAEINLDDILKQLKF